MLITPNNFFVCPKYSNTLPVVFHLQLVAHPKAHPLGGDDAKHRGGGAASHEQGRHGRHGGVDGQEPFLFSPRRLLHDRGEEYGNRYVQGRPAKSRSWMRPLHHTPIKSQAHNKSDDFGSQTRWAGDPSDRVLWDIQSPLGLPSSDCCHSCILCLSPSTNSP